MNGTTKASRNLHAADRVIVEHGNDAFVDPVRPWPVARNAAARHPHLMQARANVTASLAILSNP